MTVSQSAGGDQGAAGDSTFAGLAKWSPRPEVREEYECEACRRPHRYARPYSVPLVLFAFVFAARWTEVVFECPQCIRYRLRAGIPLRLVLANVAFPVVVIWFGVLYAQSYSRLPFDDGR